MDEIQITEYYQIWNIFLELKSNLYMLLLFSALNIDHGQRNALVR